MKLYVATLYYEAIGTNYEYFVTLNALEESLNNSKLFIRGTVSEYLLVEEEYKFNNKAWMIEKSENGIKLTQLHS